MDTKKIKAVLLAAEYKSLSAAAEVFSYTPSALSHSVDALEEELGVRLLQRTHTGVTWTKDGEALRDALQDVVNAEKALFAAARALAGTESRKLRIGTFTSIAVNLLPELLTAFKQLHPEVELSVSVGNDLKDWLEKDLVDVVFGVANPEHPWIPVLEDPYVAVVPMGSFPGKRSVSWEALYPYAFVVTDNAGASRSEIVSHFREIIHLDADDDMAAVSFVRQGMGVTVLPSLVLRTKPAGVRVLKLTDPVKRTLGLSYRKELSPDSEAMAFIRYLREVCQS